MTSSTKVTSSSINGVPLEEKRNAWLWEFTPQAEIWNDRLAMTGFVSSLIVEVVSGQGVLHVWNLM